jgi:hypothetical protein
MQNHWCVLKKSCMPYQCRADAPIYSHRPQYQSNNNEAKIVMCTQKCQVSAWYLPLPQWYRHQDPLQNQLVMCKPTIHVAFLQGFSVATTAMCGQNQTLMLHLFTATKMALQSLFRQALCMTFWVSVTCSSMAHCTDLLGIYGGNSTRSAGGNPLGTQEKHVVPEWQGCWWFCT